MTDVQHCETCGLPSPATNPYCFCNSAAPDIQLHAGYVARRAARKSVWRWEPAPAKEYKPGIRYGWPGGECPLDGDTLVEYELRDGYIGKNYAMYPSWHDCGTRNAIIAFTILERPKPTTYTVTLQINGFARAADADAAQESLENVGKAWRASGGTGHSVTITEDTETP